MVSGRGKDLDPFVVEAAIDLGDCLDLMSRQSLELLRAAHADLSRLVEEGEMEKLPENHLGKDQVFRDLDCMVINHLHTMLDDPDICASLDEVGVNYPDGGYGSVRGLFSEGAEIYPGAGFMEKTHVQLAIRNLADIKGIFRVDEDEYAFS